VSMEETTKEVQEQAGNASGPGAPEPEGATRRAVPGPMVDRFADVAGRVIAYVLDSLLVALLIFAGAAVVSLLVGPAVRFESSGVSVDRGLAVVNALVAAVVNAAYFVGSWTAVGASPAQRLLRMKIIAEVGGGRPTLAQSLIRWALLGAPWAVATVAVGLTSGGLVVQVLALGWYLVLLVSTAASRRKQGLHDRVAGTIVTRSARSLEWTSSQGNVLVR
jgi:uncharacterized RDD family membrane protein YckC